MLRSVTRNISRRSLARACATRIASPNPMMRTHVKRYAASPTDVAELVEAKFAARLDEEIGARHVTEDGATIAGR